jgi:hypothetical protein
MATAITNKVSVDTFVAGSNVDLSAHASTGTGTTGRTWAKNTAASTGAVTVSHANSDIWGNSTNSSVYVLADDPLGPDYFVYADLTCKSIGSDVIAGITFRTDPTADKKYSLVYIDSGATQEWILTWDNGSSGSVGSAITTPMVLGHVYNLGLGGLGTTIVGTIYDATAGVSIGTISGTDTNVATKGSGGIFLNGFVASDTTGKHISNFRVQRYIKYMTLGDSITEGALATDNSLGAPVLVGGLLAAAYPAFATPGIILVQEGQAGADDYDYTPNSDTLGTTDPTGGVTKGGTTHGASNNPYNIAITKGQAAGYLDIISIMLGTNSAKTSMASTLSGFQTNIGLLTAGLQTNFPAARIVLQNSPFIVVPNEYNLWDSNANTYILNYEQAEQNIVAANPTTMWYGSQLSYTSFQANAIAIPPVADNTTGSWYGDTGIHPSNLGHSNLANFWYTGINAALTGGPNGLPTTSPVTTAPTVSLSPTSTGVSVTISTPANATSIDIDADGTVTTGVTSPVSETVANLGTSHKYRARGVNASGPGPWSAYAYLGGASGGGGVGLSQSLSLSL